MIRWVAAIGWVAAILYAADSARADSFGTDDTLAAIHLSSVAYGMPEARLSGIVACETRGQPTFSPNAIGDHGTSFGAIQLHRGGLLEHFYAQGYTDAFNPYQAVEYLARALVGEWVGQGIGSWRWSCG